MNHYMREWRKTSSYAAFTRGRVRANRALPSWASTEAIASMYERAKELCRTTGVDWHVDHVIPLNGKSVCGLHVENNLQVITASQNRSKRNKFEEHAL